MWKAIRCCLLLAAIAMLLTGTAIAAPEEQASGGPIIGPLWGVYQQAPPQAIVAQYERFEITFDMTGTAPAASNLQFPFDPVGFDPNGNPEAGGVDPAGLPQAIGITVDGVFRYNGPEPAFEVIQPAFLYQPTLIEPSFGGDAKKDWIYPLGEPYWMVRFTPKQVGDWEYRIRVRDAATWNACDPGNPDSCWTYSEWRALTVDPAQSGQHGFVEVVAPGQADRRYFEFSDGSPYAGLGHRFEYAHFPGINEIKSEFERYSTYGVDFVRAWMDMALIYSEGTYGWDGWKWRDKQTSTAEVYGTHDFSVKRGYDDAIYQGSDDAQAIAGGLEAGKSYELRVRAKLTAIDTGVTPQSSDLVVKIVSNPNAWLDTGYTLCNGSLEELRMEDDGWGE
ncbi:MAG: hypothetical protein H3C34_07085 [Caldilineaceae bacterium]|nr:hypothetical protein [Caldilineaceae bacterium]